jgi:hypothetical protein
MIVLLVSANVLFYCLKTNLEPFYTFSYTGSAILASSLGIFFLVQSSKKRITKVSMVKKSKM